MTRADGVKPPGLTLLVFWLVLGFLQEAIILVNYRLSCKETTVSHTPMETKCS